jgi:ribosomal protein S18 acetylase RimI-like enzyme
MHRRGETMTRLACTIRPATLADVDETFSVRGATRENAVPRERLAALGITPASVSEAMQTGTYASWVAETDGRIVGFCNAEAQTGEVIVLAILDGYERRGIGRALLSQAVDFLHGRGCPRLWLMAGSSDRLRSHGFYRANGWVPTGRHDAIGDEELEYAGTRRVAP